MTTTTKEPTTKEPTTKDAPTNLYVSKLPEVEALQYTGRNGAEIVEWGAACIGETTPGISLQVTTPLGTHVATVRDWILRAPKDSDLVYYVMTDAEFTTRFEAKKTQGPPAAKK